MAQCHAEEKKHPNGTFEFCAGAFNKSLYSYNGGHDPVNNWSAYDTSGFGDLPGKSDDTPMKEASMDRLPVSCGSFREEKQRNGHVAATSNPGPNGLFVGAGKAGGASPKGSETKNASSDGGGSMHRRHNSDLSAGGKSGNSSSGELGRSAMKQATETTSSKVCPASRPREANNGASSVASNTRGSPGCGSLIVGGVHADSSSSSGSSNGGSPTAESSKGGRSSTMGNILGNGGSTVGGTARGTGNILGPSTNLNGMVTGSLRSSANKASANGVQSSPTGFRGTSSPKTSGEISPNGNISSRGAAAIKPSSEGNLSMGITSGTNSKSVKSGSGSPVRSSPSISNVGNVCRGNVLNPKANCSSTNKTNIKLDAPTSTVRSVGNVISGLPSKGNGKTDAYKSVGENGNSQLATESNLKRLHGVMDAEEVKNAGNKYYKQGHFAEALSLYDKAISLSPGQPSFHSNRAAALIGLGRLAEAVQECQEAIKLDPNYIRAHQRAASLYLRFGLVESAKRHHATLGQYIDAGDIYRIQNVGKHISRSIEARKARDWKAVIRECDAAVVAGADSAPQIYGYKAEALLKLQRPNDADSVLAAAERVESSLIKPGVVTADSSLFIIRAQIDLALGRFEEAVAAAESGARIDQRNTEATALLMKTRVISRARAAGNEAFKAGRFFEACACYGEGLESDPRNAVLLCNRAACRSKLGQWEKAVEDCNAALSIQPNYMKALLRRADCNTKLERWEEALRDYETLQREAPGDMELARGLFEVQIAIKKSRGEEIYKMKFGGEVEEVSNNDQYREAVTSPGLAVIQFNTRWNDHCKQLSPFIDELCRRYPSVNFARVDVADHPYLAKTESVTFVPTFKLYKNGLKLKEILGPSQQALEYAIKHYII